VSEELGRFFFWVPLVPWAMVFATGHWSYRQSIANLAVGETPMGVASIWLVWPIEVAVWQGYFYVLFGWVWAAYFTAGAVLAWMSPELVQMPVLLLIGGEMGFVVMLVRGSLQLLAVCRELPDAGADEWPRKYALWRYQMVLTGWSIAGIGLFWYAGGPQFFERAFDLIFGWL